MQAQGMKRFTFNPISGTTLSIAVLAGALGVGGVMWATTDRTDDAGTTIQAAAPATIYNPPADRSLREGFNPSQAIVTDSTRAHYSPNMGEGLLDLQLEQTAKPVYPAQVEGTFLEEGIAPSVIPSVKPVRGIHPSLGEGFYADEGIAPLVMVKPEIKAYASLGQGEGIIGGHNVYPRAVTLDTSAVATIDTERMRFLELNLHLPGSDQLAAAGAGTSAADVKFWENNVYLPTSEAAVSEQTHPQVAGFTAE